MSSNNSLNIVNLSNEEKKTIGAEINNLKKFITEQLAIVEEDLNKKDIEEKLNSETMDITLPIRESLEGGIHPIIKTQKELLEVFSSMGFSITDGPEIEDDYHCFEGANIPKHHPARQMQDTFYLKKFENLEIVLRAQTTAIQTREMSTNLPPFKFITMGKTFRREMDSTHTPMFHQIDGVYIDKNINLQDLRNCLMTFFKKFFNLKEAPLRFRPSYFPFTSPSLEVDIKCKKEEGKLILGTGNDWLEAGGAGMVHPNVLRNCNIDPKQWQGFAFGFGVDRLCMLKYGIRDLRNLFEGDLRFLYKNNFKIYEG